MTLLKHSTSYVTHWPSWYLMQNSMKVPQPQHKLIYSVLVVDNLAIKIRLRDSAIRAGEDRVTIHFAIVTHATKIEMTMWSIPGLVSHERFFFAITALDDFGVHYLAMCLSRRRHRLGSVVIDWTGCLDHIPNANPASSIQESLPHPLKYCIACLIWILNMWAA